MNMNTDTAYQPAARSSFDEPARPRDIQRSTNGKPLWNKAFLITFWVLQIIICIVAWGFGAFGLVVKSYSDSEDADTALRYLYPDLIPLNKELQLTDFLVLPLASI
jgi:hypothetical protein